jgi:wobble nucleotide-excising tRNase
MITKIRRLKNIGKFYDYSTKGVGLDWHKNTFVIAPNAYGKSTLVDVFRSVRDNDPKVIRARRTLGSVASPEAVIIIDGENHVFNGTKWDKPYPAVQIFDVPFIHTNILSREIEHEHRKNIHRIIIGVQGIKFAEELADLKTKEKKKRQQFDKLSKEFNAAGFDHHTVDAFLAIPASEEAAVVGRIQKLEQDIKSKESETQVRALGYPRAVSAPAFDLSAAKTLAGQKLAAAHEAAETRVLEHIDQNFKQKGQAQEFIRQGLDLVQADCPFCGQDLKDAADLLRAYREFFDDAFRTYQRNLKENAEALANWNLENDLTGLVSSHNANTATLNQWEPFIGAETLLPDASAFVETARTKLTGLKAKVQTELQKKQKDPNADADLSQFEALSAELASLKADIVSYNAAVTAFTKKAKDYVANLPKSDVNSIRLALAKEREIEERFKPEWKKWATDYPAAKEDASGILAKKDKKQKELEVYTRTIFDTYQKRINQLLVSLGADFTITDLTGKTDARANESYTDFGFLILEKKVPLTVRQDDAPCFKNTLSEGDKGTLAFAFFIASLEKTPDLDKQIVILDDPTHKKDFLQMLFDKIPSNTVLQVRSDKKNGSSLEAFDVEEDRKGEYVHMVEDLERYVDEDFGPTPDTMQGNIRKVFEIVLKTKYYRALAEDIKAKKGLAKLLETLFGAGLLDVALKPKLFDLCSVTNGPHHGEIVDAPSKKLMRDELIPLINEALGLLEKV